MTLRRATEGLAICLALGVLMLSPPADAAKSQKILHSSPPAPVAPPPPPPLPPAEPFPADAPSKPELVIGGLHASLAATDLATIQTVGGTAFLTFTVANADGNASVQLSADAEKGTVAAITGNDVQTSKISGGLSAQIPLAGNKPTPVVIQLAIKDGTAGPDGKLRTRLRLKLATKKGGTDTAIVSLPVADCAGDYKKQLSHIIEQRHGTMVTTLDAVSAPEAGWSPNWVFTPPKFAAPAPVAACKPAKGKTAAVCPPPTPPKANADGSKPFDDARIFELAGNIMQQRGALPSFQTHRQPMREASYTMLSSLREYMEQDSHPALCSGVDYMLDYYKAHTGLLRDAIEDTKTALERARTLAAQHVAELLQPAAADGSAAPAAKPGAWSSFAPEDLVAVVGGAVLPDADIAKLKGDKDIWAKLHRLRDVLSGAATASLPPQRKAAAVSALQYIEASQYLGAAVPKYQRLDDNIYVTMSAIGEAHKAACVCGT